MDYKSRRRTLSGQDLVAAQRRVDVIRLWDEGMSREEIVKQSGLTSSWVGQVIMKHRTAVVLAEVLGPEEGKRVFNEHFEGVKNLLKEHRWSPTRELLMEWVQERDTFYREHALRMAECGGWMEN